MNYLKTKIYKKHGEKYTLTKLIIHITEYYAIFIVDWMGVIPLKILIYN